jgi:2-aminoadipate transaminase
MAAELTRFFSEAARQGPPLVMPAPPAPLRYNFDAGYPAPEAFPIEDFRRIAGEVLADRSALSYTSVHYDADSGEPIYEDVGFRGRLEMSLGNESLRGQLAEWIGRRQAITGLDSSNFVLTSGATQAIALACAAFVNPGEGALIESLTFAWAYRSLSARGADVRMVELDDEGMVVESLEARLQEMRADGVKPKLLYLIPSYQLPTGTVLPLERRRRILDLAEEWDLVVIEDAIYADLGYDGEAPPPSLFHLDRSGRVMQAHAFSKIIAAGLRLGWMAGHPDMIRALAAVREDLGVSQWLCRIVDEFMREGKLDAQIERAAGIYRRKRDRAAAGLTAAAGDLVDFRLPNGGIFLWVRLDDAVDWDAAKADAALRGVAVREADQFMLAAPETSGPRHFRLGFGHCSDTEIDEGTAALGAAISAAVRSHAG